jgi:hypothetical protein
MTRHSKLQALGSRQMRSIGSRAVASVPDTLGRVDDQTGDRDLRVRMLDALQLRLLADETELRRRIPADLPRILVLEEWWHRDPDRYDQLPSETATFQQLAQVLTSGDLTTYRPSRAPNTHWSNWPESGSL